VHNQLEGEHDFDEKHGSGTGTHGTHGPAKTLMVCVGAFLSARMSDESPTPECNRPASPRSGGALPGRGPLRVFSDER